MPHSPHVSLHRPILAATSKAYRTIRAITLLASHIPQLSPLQPRLSCSIARMNKAYTEVRGGRLLLPNAEGITSSVARDIDEIAEEVDDYILFWSEGGDMVVDGVVLGLSFVRHGGERGVLERRKKKMLVEGIMEGVRNGDGSQRRKGGWVPGRWREEVGEERGREGEGRNVRVEFIGDVKDGGAIKGDKGKGKDI